MTPTTLHRVMVHDFRDALDDFTGDVPSEPEDFTSGAITTLLSHLAACESYLRMLRYQAERIERCGAAECSDAADAAAAVLASPTLRERLGRAPLGGAFVTVQPYSIQRARQMNYILTAAQPAMNYAYEKLVDTYRVQSLHDLTDDQLNELVVDVQAWEKEKGLRG